MTQAGARGKGFVKGGASGEVLSSEHPVVDNAKKWKLLSDGRKQGRSVRLRSRKPVQRGQRKVRAAGGRSVLQRWRRPRGAVSSMAARNCWARLNVTVSRNESARRA